MVYTARYISRYIVILLSFLYNNRYAKQVLRVSAAFHVLFCDSDIDLNGQEDVKVADVTTPAVADLGWFPGFHGTPLS